jgi:EAL domain-containing protein (putative c-di-GMP-specific phosphodiesterase class I)
LRWRLDDGDYVPPDRFIPLAEYSGLIVALGEWVLRSACRDAVRLHQTIPSLRMAVNLSVAQLRNPLFGAMLERALADTGISPAALELEITESMAMHPEDDIAGLVARIKRLGISVAIDDFGTGFSSLAYLEELGVDRLKIDKAFVGKLNPATCQESVAATVAQLARQLRLKVIAEGVENEAQRDCLKRMQVDEAQGWLYAKGMPVEELEIWLKSRS